ncbi:MAG: hypothetical protein U0271_39360 [Polyangiaceae bacterium]
MNWTDLPTHGVQSRPGEQKPFALELALAMGGALAGGAGELATGVGL